MSLVIKRVCDVCGEELKMPKSTEEYRDMLFKSQLKEWIFTKAATGIDLCENCRIKIDYYLLMEYRQIEGSDIR